MSNIIDILVIEDTAFVIDVQAPLIGAIDVTAPSPIQTIDIAVEFGAQGPPGPTAISADANNAARLGTDNLVFVPITISSSAPSGGSDGDIWFKV